MNKTKQTIDFLVEDLTPTKGHLNASKIALSWWLAGTLITLLAMMIAGPFRPHILDQLITSPRFLLESMLGLFVCASIACTVPELGIPDTRSFWRRARLPLLLLTTWFALFFFALESPVLAPTMAGKRELCYREAFIYSVPLTLLGLLLIRRLMPLKPALTGGSIGVAAGLVPAWLMQFACMHEPWHIISHHLFPLIGAALIGATLGCLILRRPST